MRSHWIRLLLAASITSAAALAACANDDDDAGSAAAAESATHEVVSGGACSVPTSDFAKSTVALLEARFCDEAKDGDRHENPAVTDEVQQEKDTIFQLLAFALVAEHWDLRRGQQIGAVIVKGDKVLKAGFNANFAERSAIEHAEVRALRGFYMGGVSGSPSGALENATIYTTLEPCPMCAGTITMARVKRVVFGMKDIRFGDALAYLHSFPFHADFQSHYDTRTSKRLTEEYMKNPDQSIGPMLDRMKYAFEWAKEDLAAYQVRFPQNETALANARAALAETP